METPIESRKLYNSKRHANITEPISSVLPDGASLTSRLNHTFHQKHEAEARLPCDAFAYTEMILVESSASQQNAESSATRDPKELYPDPSESDGVCILFVFALADGILPTVGTKQKK